MSSTRVNQDVDLDVNCIREMGFLFLPISDHALGVVLSIPAVVSDEDTSVDDPSLVFSVFYNRDKGSS